MRYLRTIYTIILSLVIISCSSSKKFFEENTNALSKSADIRILLEEHSSHLSYHVDNSVLLYNGDKIVAVVKAGNYLQFLGDGRTVVLSIKNKIYYGDYFQIKSENENSYINFNGKNFKGKIRFFIAGDSLRAVNVLPLEEYLKGVIPAEIPLKNGNNYYEAVKAFTICARTYSIMKMNLKNPVYDVYTDVRDQVYGGADRENPISNKAVEETRGMILTYDGKPATVYYSSTCGGHTENASNVFTKEDLPYLRGVTDGDPAYCSISPKFKWQESYSGAAIINRLFAAGYLADTGFDLDTVYVLDRFNSGRVNHLVFLVHPVNSDTGTGVNVKSTVMLAGNYIRYVIKTPDNKNILESTLFDITFDKENREVVINGKGFGHGVGLCQWGSIGMAESGFDYRRILYHYFPGTSISRYYDLF